MKNSDQIFNRKKPKIGRITHDNGDGNRHAYSKNIDRERGSSDQGLKTKGSKVDIINEESNCWGRRF